MRVFLSYRRSDVGGHAGRLSDELVRQLGPRDVFHDVSTIAPGEHFPAAIERALADSEVVLAVIGPTWLTSATADGTPRLLQPGDYVRMELGRALALGRTVTPVLVGGASLPSEGDLPEELRPLALRQAVTLHDESWHEDVAGLLRRLRGQPAGPARRTRRPAVAAAVAAAVVIALAAIGGVAWWPGIGDTDGGDAVATLPPCTAPDADAWTALSLAGGAAGEITVENG
ncbi:MAG: toll/interleukin-1 receptor domain-containing protein, partial [Dehalococcoidia bacterium]